MFDELTDEYGFMDGRGSVASVRSLSRVTSIALIHKEALVDQRR